jgi:hypothetical protein
MPRIGEGVSIDYRHIIDSLIRKPGAFANYQYRAQLFPQPIFRVVYDQLTQDKPATSHKSYLKILHLAKCHGEGNVVAVLSHLFKACQLFQKLPNSRHVKPPLDLQSFDRMSGF